MRRRPIHPVDIIASISGSISFGPTSTYTGPWAMDTPPLVRGVTISSERGLGLGMRVRCEDGILAVSSRLPAFPS